MTTIFLNDTKIGSLSQDGTGSWQGLAADGKRFKSTRLETVVQKMCEQSGIPKPWVLREIEGRVYGPRQEIDDAVMKFVAKKQVAVDKDE